jgi:predicted small lipoprotein YifL
MPRALHAVLAACLAALMLSACGNKGPLVLPDQQPAKKHKGSQPEQKAPGQKPADPVPAPASGTDSGH